MIGLSAKKGESEVSYLVSLLITQLSCSLIGVTQDILIQQDSLAYKIYGKSRVIGSFNCNYSLNHRYRDLFQQSNLHFVGENSDGDVRIIELPGPQYFLATLFQPQLSLDDNNAHPVIVEYLMAVSGSVR